MVQLFTDFDDLRFKSIRLSRDHRSLTARLSSPPVCWLVVRLASLILASSQQTEATWAARLQVKGCSKDQSGRSSYFGETLIVTSRLIT